MSEEQMENMTRSGIDEGGLLALDAVHLLNGVSEHSACGCRDAVRCCGVQSSSCREKGEGGSYCGSRLNAGKQGGMCRVNDA